jgi:acyl dehydratase
MPLDPSKIGARSKEYTLEYDFRTTILYALGIGAKAAELDYLYEGRGPKVHPSFSVVPSYPVLMDLIGQSGGNFGMVVHAGQSFTMHRPFPKRGTLTTQGSITAMYDLKRLSQLILKSQSLLDGEPICETEWSLMFRGEGNFGGERPPKSTLPKVPADHPLEWEHREATSAEQALLYRLSGDLNPLHADPAFAKSVGFDAGPILHGLGTYGFLCRALMAEACNGDGDRVRHLSAQFKKPVWPGDVLTTKAYRVEGQLLLAMFAEGRAEPVATGHAELT